MPKQLIYIIDAFKFQAVLIGLLSVIMLGISFSTVVEHVQAAGSLGSYIPAPYETYPHSKNTPPPAQVATVIIPVGSGESIWPLHGIVTTQFGEPHQPWQRTHTGLDISSAKPSGVSAVVAFRGGTVADVVHAYGGFGNHVIIDHGGGLTSLYGHLYSTSVSKGQVVHAGDVIGREGSTGASTGTHLHFEIRQNGQPINPRGQVPGSP